MNPNECFIRESERIMRENTISGQYYVLYVDLTDFHTINHFYGNDCGDVLLQEMEALLTGLKEIRLCSRIYADLFLCLCFLEDGKSVEEVMNSYDAVMQEFIKEKRKKYPACKLKAACGGCRIENGQIAQAMDDANVARKVSKKQLQFKGVLYDWNMAEQTKLRHESERQIYQAIQDKRFCFYLQPQVDLTSGRIVGAEALARRISEDGRIVFPDRFLDLMESTGAVMELDRIICRQVCAFLQERLDKNLPVVCISVNLSRLHIDNPEAADEFHAIAEEFHIPPELLGFELKETILLEEFTGTKCLIDRLRAYGHRVSIDNFGSGYAGSNIWQELNFDCLKLDQKFLTDKQPLKERNEVIVPNIINIANRLHIQVLCEGVETEAQCRYLLQLGCTAVQGIYFSEPLPPRELCRLCEKNDGRYPLSPSISQATEEGSAEQVKVMGRGRFSDRIKFYLAAIICCAVFLGVSITGVLTVNRNLTHQEFTEMVLETLNAYTNGQRENTLTEIDGAITTLQSLAALIEKENDPEFVNSYLLTLNEESAEVKYMYLSEEEYLDAMARGEIKEKDIESMELLEQGKNVVTDIVYSERMGNIYCIGVGVPVIKDGVFVGAVRGIVNAEALVSTEVYDPAQGEVCAAFLTDGDSVILPIRAADGRGVGESLLKRLYEYGIEADVMKELSAAYAKNDTQARSVRLGTFDGQPYYLSLTGLKYNNWHLVVCLKADAASKHFQYILRNTVYSIACLLTAVILASVIVLLVMKKMQKKFSMDEQRYLLLERFSDTVLFDYDCCHDTIRFTSNAPKFLRIHDLTQRDFLKNRNRIYVYAGDQKEVQQMLTGKLSEHAGEVRVRLMRPDVDEYFWCLAQYQYFYENDELVSVIGKLTDIDEHMRHEDYLLRMSETDGLTGLLNKGAVEKQVSDYMAKGGKGILFIIDMDDFKQVNDRYGHAAGDRALKFLGDCMKRTYRSSDIIGRIGGDELLVFMEETDNPEGARKKAELLEKHLESCTLEDVPDCTVSIGAAQFPKDGENYAKLFHAADQAMYAAKARGKRQICFFSELENKEAKE